MNKYLVLIGLIISGSSFSQDDGIELNPVINNIVTEEMIIKKLISISEMKEEKFSTEMSRVNTLSQKYIDQKEKVCAGKLTTIDINEDGTQVPTEKKEERIKLTPKERRLCKYMLVKFRVKYTNEAFKIRKSYLVNQQADQLESLDNLRKDQVKELEKLSHKYK